MSRSEVLDRRIKLRHLRTLVAVAENRSMVKAAASLAVSQPVVSKTIADLERILGMRLVERGQRGVALTHLGRALLTRSVSILDDVRSSVRELELLADPVAGNLCIGVTEAMAFTLVPAVISKMSQSYPRVTFEIIQGPPESLVDRDLRGRRVEFVLGRGPIEHSAHDLEVDVLCRDDLRVIAGRNHPLASRKKITLRDLVNERWTLPPKGHPVRTFVNEAFRLQGLPAPSNVVAIGGALLTTRLAAGGAFIAVVGSAAIEIDFSPVAVKVLPINLSTPDWFISVINLRKRPIGPLGTLFVKSAREIVAPLERLRLSTTV